MTSQSTLLLRSTIRPQRQAQYLWTISYQTLNANGKKKYAHSVVQRAIYVVKTSTFPSAGSASSPPQVLCEVQATVVYPTLMVIDVCTGGSVGKLSKVHLWKLFSLDRLNMHLRSSPTPAELTHRGGRKQRCLPLIPNTCIQWFTQSFSYYNMLNNIWRAWLYFLYYPYHRIYSSFFKKWPLFVSSPSVFTDSKLNFDFSAAPLHSDPSVFVLIFHNPCCNPVEW